MITALETGCRLVLMVTLLTLVAIFAAFQLGRPAGRATTSGARWSPQDAPRIRTVQPAETFGGAWRSARRWWLAFSHTEPRMQDVPGRMTCPVVGPLREGRSRGGWSPSARAGACPSVGSVPNRRPTTAGRKESEPGGGRLPGHYA
jgi:hypothetical protein